MANQQVLKSPPTLLNEDFYGEWKHDLTIWQMYTDLPRNKQGPAVFLTLTGRARDCIRDLQPEEIGHENGVKKITDKLDTLFLKDENIRVYLAFKEFYNYRRPSEVSMIDFLIKFEYLYHKLSSYKLQLPEGIRAFFLLTAANMSDENERLARATCVSMTYENMKCTIKKIF